MAGALASLAGNDANRVAIAAAGGIAPLVELVRGGSAGAKEHAAGGCALANLPRQRRQRGGAPGGGAIAEVGCGLGIARDGDGKASLVRSGGGRSRGAAQLLRGATTPTRWRSRRRAATRGARSSWDAQRQARARARSEAASDHHNEATRRVVTRHTDGRRMAPLIELVRGERGRQGGGGL